MARGRPVGGGVAVGCGAGGVLPHRLPLHLCWRCIADKKIRKEGCGTRVADPGGAHERGRVDGGIQGCEIRRPWAE
jgi:hypothetical protein